MILNLREVSICIFLGLRVILVGVLKRIVVYFCSKKQRMRI